MKLVNTLIKYSLLLMLAATLSACDNTAVYGGVTMSSGYSSYGSSSMRGSISISGRIR